MGSTPRGISGSRAAAVLGQSPWSTPFRVWQDIMEDLKPGFNAAQGFDYEAFEGNASTRWGLAFEDAIIKLAEGRHAGIHDREAEHSVKGHDYITCHIDGQYEHKVYTVKEIEVAPLILHEGKTTTAYGFGDKWGEPGGDKIPVEYQIQTQHQMLCTGADECIVSVLVFPKRPDDWEAEGLEASDKTLHIDKHGDTIIGHHGNYAIYADDKVFATPEQWAVTLAQMGYFHQYTIKANRDLQTLMLDKYRVWWTKYVIGETPPAPANYADIRAMITAPVGTIIVDPDTARWFKERRDINDEIGKGGNLSKRSEQLKTLILERAYVRENEMCPHDKALDYKTCHAQCGQPECTIGKGRPVLDDESTDKWIFRDGKGNKLGSYGRTAKGTMVFR